MIDQQSSILEKDLSQNNAVQQTNQTLDDEYQLKKQLIKDQKQEKEDESIEKESNHHQEIDQFRQKNKWYFLPFISFIFIGGFFNNTFQAFIKQQFQQAMQISNFQYDLFVLIPPIPNFILPIFAGPLLDKVGLRKSIIIYTSMTLIGMILCLISCEVISFPLMVTGKTIHQIGSEMVCIAQSAMITKWFNSNQLTIAYTTGSFIQKVSSSLSGILFPEFYAIQNDLKIPLIVSVSTCAFSLISAFIVALFDKKADKSIQLVTESQQKRKVVNVKFKDLKNMGFIYWIYGIQPAICFGGFYALVNQLQTILVKKFNIDQLSAGQIVSIPFWIALSAPIFGYVADKFGRRIFSLAGSAILGFTTVFLFLILPGNSDIGLIYVTLIIYGVFISSLQAYIYPCYPLIVSKRFVGTAFGIGYAIKNLGLSIFSYFGGQILGEKQDQFISFFIFFMILFIFSFILQMIAYFLDKKNNGNLNSSKPKIPKETQEIINILKSFQAN